MLKCSFKHTGRVVKYDEMKNQFKSISKSDNLNQRNIGLSVIKSIVQHANGKIKFASEDNSCTEFSVFLPIKAKSSIFASEISAVPKCLVILKKGHNDDKLQLAKDSKLNYSSLFVEQSSEGGPDLIAGRTLSNGTL